MPGLRTVLALSALALAHTATAQENPSAGQLAVVDAEYANQGLNLQTNAGFGIDLTSSALMTATYPFGVVTNGATYPVDQLANAPTINVYPSAASTDFNASSVYTLVLADASSLGDPDPQGNYRHFLMNGLTGSGASFVPGGEGTVVTAYAAPGPLQGSGLHRYAWLLFLQPATFTAPADLAAAGTASGHWSVANYTSSTGLTLVASTFFTVAGPGDATGSVATTSPVDTSAILASATGASTAAANATDSAASSAAPTALTTTATRSIPNASSTSAPAATSTGAAASNRVGKAVAALVGGVVGVAALL